MGTVPNPKYAQLPHIAIAAVSLVSILLIAKFARGFIANISVLLGIVIAAVIATALGYMNFDKVGKAPWVDFVLPFEIATPVFDPILILTMTLVMIVVMIESTGMFLALSDITGKKIDQKQLSAGLRVDGLGTFIGGIFNTFPYTSFSQNVGLVGVTGVKSRYVCVAAGVIMVLLGLLPKMAALVESLPTFVLGGAGLVMFGMVAATGIRILASVDYKGNRNNLFIVAVVLQHGGALHAAASDLQKTFAGLREAVLQRAPIEGSLATQVLSALGFFAAKLDNLVETWRLVLAEDVDGEAPVARWIELHDSTSSSIDYLVCASPISGSDKLRQLLWNRASGVILMSATLTSCGTFDLFLQQSGLSVYTAVQFLRVESPFDYRSNARLVIPAMRSDPGDARRHTDEVVERMPGLVQTLGTLVLFASGKQMREVYALLPEDLRRCTLMQGTMPKMEMLSRHRAAIDSGERSVLFGLQSFSEGVDLPREYCTHVVCAKLPFSVPDSPLEEARREWIESQGRSPFIDITVPETAVRLKQQLGRLIRTDEDHGTATILDRRLVSRRWGRLLMRGLPDFELVVEPARGCAASGSRG
ncbi:MAG: hypothetical protein MUF08_00645 [Burkholderiaceae bacterium]|nr:hypothetical protein [Burkholderiaceae bacterium]